MEEITIAQVREAKKQLEQELLDRVKRFTEETGMKVILLDISLSLEPNELYEKVIVELSLT